MLTSPLPWMRCNRTWTAVDLIFCSPIKWFPRCPKQSGWVIRENHFAPASVLLLLNFSPFLGFTGFLTAKLEHHSVKSSSVGASRCLLDSLKLLLANESAALKFLMIQKTVIWAATSRIVILWLKQEDFCSTLQIKSAQWIDTVVSAAPF